RRRAGAPAVRSRVPFDAQAGVGSGSSVSAGIPEGHPVVAEECVARKKGEKGRRKSEKRISSAGSHDALHRAAPSGGEVRSGGRPQGREGCVATQTPLPMKYQGRRRSQTRLAWGALRKRSGKAIPGHDRTIP